MSQTNKGGQTNRSKAHQAAARGDPKAIKLLGQMEHEKKQKAEHKARIAAAEFAKSRAQVAAELRADEVARQEAEDTRMKICLSNAMQVDDDALASYVPSAAVHSGGGNGIIWKLLVPGLVVVALVGFYLRFR